jgi:hypothetical protein
LPCTEKDFPLKVRKGAKKARMTQSVNNKRPKYAATTTNNLQEGAVRVVLRPGSQPFSEKGREANPLFSKLLASRDQVDFNNQS